MDSVLILFGGFAVVIIIALALMGIGGIANKRQKETENRMLADANAEKIVKQTENQRKYAESAKPTLEQIYIPLYDLWHRPENPQMVEVIRAKSDDELHFFQGLQPVEQSLFMNSCDCWVADGVFYLLETKDAVLSRAQNFPGQFETKVNGEQNFCHIAIPIKNIHYYKCMGELIRSQKVVGGGNATYTGVSVNGIGFGEFKQNPSFILPEFYDSRYIVLYYKPDSRNELDALYLGYDSLDALIRVIPQFEK